MPFSALLTQTTTSLDLSRYANHKTEKVYISIYPSVSHSFTNAHSSYPYTYEGWPCTEFHSIISIAFAYVALAFIGSAIMKTGVPALSSKTGGVPAIDPYYPIKLVYNVPQILLSA